MSQALLAVDEVMSERQLACLDACVVAAVALSGTDDCVENRAHRVMECHERLVYAWGPTRRAPDFSEFVHLLMTGSVGELVPDSEQLGDVASQRFLAGDGTASAWLTELALGAADDSPNASGLGTDVRHLRSVLRALQRVPEGSALAKITAEAVQHAVFMVLSEKGSAPYSAGRKALVRTPVARRRGMPEHLVELGVYRDISVTRQFAGRWMACPFCNWTMRVTPRGPGKAEFSCEDRNHLDRGARFLAVNDESGWRVTSLGDLGAVPQMEPTEGRVALSFGLWRWITMPGLLELDLYEQASALGADVELWPHTDAYDLHIVKTSGATETTWRVDVKTWGDAQGIAPRMMKDPDGLKGLCVVVPLYQEGYLPVLNLYYAKTPL